MDSGDDSLAQSPAPEPQAGGPAVAVPPAVTADSSPDGFRAYVTRIAHDFNNILSTIAGHAIWLQSCSRPGDEIHDTASVILQAASRAAELSRDLLHDSQGWLSRRQVVDLHGILTELAALLRRGVGDSVRVVLKMDAQEAAVLGDPGQLHRLFLNLALNARDAMPEGGAITLETCCPGDGTIRVMVSDEGCGIPAEIRSQVFDAFVTTKTASEGSGLGLSIVRQIAGLHGGTVSLVRSGGNGCTFEVRLPLSPPAEHHQTAELPQP